MKDTKRKIGFFYLFLKDGEELRPLHEELSKLLRYINGQSRRAKKRDISDDRFCFLDIHEFVEDGNLLKILFKSAKHSYRAPLLNKNTVEERENPKTIEEGEQIKTHLLLKFTGGDTIVFLETFRGALSLKIVTDYLNEWITIYNANHRREKIRGKFTFDMIPRDDFREVLDNMQRVICASIFIEKRILGSDSLNFSEMTNNIQEDVILEVKSKRGESMKHAVYDFLAKLNGGRSVIQKIRVKGVLPNNNESIIDSSFIIKKEYIDAQQDEDTGEINTAYLFSQLLILSRGF